MYCVMLAMTAWRVCLFEMSADDRQRELAMTTWRAMSAARAGDDPSA
jgi:hypothetical protein